MFYKVMAILLIIDIILTAALAIIELLIKRSEDKMIDQFCKEQHKLFKNKEDQHD